MLLAILPNILNSTAHEAHCLPSGLDQQYASDPGLFQAVVWVLLMLTEQYYPAIILQNKFFLYISVLSFKDLKAQIFLNCLSRRQWLLAMCWKVSFVSDIN